MDSNLKSIYAALDSVEEGLTVYFIIFSKTSQRTLSGTAGTYA